MGTRNAKPGYPKYHGEMENMDFFHFLMFISDGSGSGEKWAFKRQIEQAFSSFFAKFWAYLMIFQSGAC